MPVYADPVGGVAIGAAELGSWTSACVERLGTPADIAIDVATVLVASDRCGIASHGTARLPSWEPSRSAWSTEIELLVSARTAPNAPGRVLIPGEPEAAAERRSEGHGVSLDRGHYQSLLELSDSYDLPLPESTTL